MPHAYDDERSKADPVPDTVADEAARRPGGPQGAVWVNFRSDGSWDPAQVLGALESRTNVPESLREAIAAGPRETALLCHRLRTRLEKLAESDPTRDAEVDRACRALTSRITELWFGSPSSPTTYDDLAKVARWQEQYSASGAAQAKAVAEAEDAADTEVAADPEAEADKPITSADDDRLSEGRKAFIKQGELRMGSAEGWANTKSQREKGKINLFEGVAKQEKGTSCGLLPAVMMRRVGVKGAITNYNVGGLRDEGKKLGIWRDAKPGDRPLPGDAYMLEERPGGDVKHVGIVYNLDHRTPNGSPAWQTMDSGQGGSVQKADFVTRQVDYREDGTWLSPANTEVTSGDTAGWKYLAGWVNIDDLLRVAGPKKK